MSADIDQIRPLSDMTLDELAGVVRSEHELCEASIERARAEFGDALRHALAAGEALLVVQKSLSPYEWHDWIKANLPFTSVTANRYARLAYYRDQVEQHITETPDASIRSAAKYIQHELPTRSTGVPRDEYTVSRARALHKNGTPVRRVAEELDISWDTAKGYIDPEYQKRRIARASKKALREKQELDRALTSASPAARPHVRDAMSSIHKAEDALVAAMRADS